MQIGTKNGFSSVVFFKKHNKPYISKYANNIHGRRPNTTPK